MARLSLAQRLYFEMERDGEAVAMPERTAARLGISTKHARRVLRDACLAGLFERVRGGLYARVPPALALGKGLSRPEATVVGAHLVPPYYLSHYPALQIHGLSMRAVNTLFLTAPKRHRPFEYRGYRFKFVTVLPRRFFGFEERPYAGQQVVVSDRERTLIDVMDRPQYAGGWGEVVECLQDYGEVDWERVLAYLERWGKKVVARRLGYVMRDVLGTDVPKEALERLRERWVDRVKLPFTRGRRGHYVREWGVLVDDEVFKESLV